MSGVRQAHLRTIRTPLEGCAKRLDARQPTAQLGNASRGTPRPPRKTRSHCFDSLSRSTNINVAGRRRSLVILQGSGGMSLLCNIYYPIIYDFYAA